MKNIHSIEFYTGSKEELLPGFEKDFPYIASRAELDKYIGCYVPWHWHRTVELFYMESGSIEYDTPGGKILFPAGSGGMINPNVLHMTKAISQREKNIQLNIECRDWKDAIRKSAEPLLFKGYIEERYVDAMIENVLENGSYIVISKGFALPHEGFELGSKKVGMNMIRLKEPVVIEDEDGDREEVRFFCCLSTVDHKKHIKAFFHLVNMLTNQRFKEELWNAESPRETAAIIKTYEQRIKE